MVVIHKGENMKTTNLIDAISIVIISKSDRHPDKDSFDELLQSINGTYHSPPRVLEDSEAWKYTTLRIKRKKEPLKKYEERRVEKLKNLDAAAKRWAVRISFDSTLLTEETLFDFVKKIYKMLGITNHNISIETEQVKVHGGGGDTFEHIFIEHIEEKNELEILFSLKYHIEFEPSDIVKISKDGKTKTLYDGTIIEEE